MLQEKNVYVDKGLKAYFSNIYQYLGLNLLLAGATSFFVLSEPRVFRMFFGTPLFYVLMFAPLGIVMYLGRSIERISFSKAQGFFWAYGIIQGALMSGFLSMYTFESVVRCFMISAAVFLSAAVYGRYTSKDLSSMRSILNIGIFGVIIASLVNIFMGSSLVQHMISWAVIGIFTALVASDMQQLLAIYFTRQSKDNFEKIAVMGALSLFISFINIFISILQLFGDRKDR